MERFVGKIAVVTGSSFGIGESISRELLKRGVNVVGLARNVPRLQEMEQEIKSDPKTYSGKFFYQRCDVRDVQDIKNSFNWIKNNVGPVSILVNNAGVLIREPTVDLKEESFDNTFDTNVKALVMCAQEAIRSMLENNVDGHILNITSIAGNSILKTARNHSNMMYTASKHAARIFSEGLRRDMSFKKANIKVTNVCPGLVITDMTKAFILASNTDSTECLHPKDIADACISVIDTASNVVISDITVLPIHTQFP